MRRETQPTGSASSGVAEEVVVASGMIDAHAGGVALTGSHPEGTLALISGTSNCHMLASQTEIHTPGVWGPYWSAMLPGYWLTEGGQSAAGALVDWTLREHGASADLFAKAEAAQRHPVALLNDWVAALEQEENIPPATCTFWPITTATVRRVRVRMRGAAWSV